MCTTCEFLLIRDKNNGVLQKSYLHFIKDSISKAPPILYIISYADVVKLVDTLDLGSSAARRGGSSPFIRTIPDLLLLKPLESSNGRDIGAVL